MLAFRPITFHRLAGLALAALQLLCLPSFAQKEAPKPQAAGQPAAEAQAAASYGRIPLSFEANRGQTDPSVQFLSHGQGYTLFLRQGEALLALRSGEPAEGKSASNADSHGNAKAPSSEIETSLVQMKLVGANAHATVREEDKQVAKTNYFIGKDPAKWRTDIPNYGRVRYADIYPGIDLVYYGDQSRLEYDFLVSPGADPKRIRFCFDSGRLRLDRDGNLNVTVKNVEIAFDKPFVFQEIDGKRQPVGGSFVLRGDSNMGFTLGAYDHAKPLVIDPVLVYSTYLGGSGITGHGDQGTGIAVDASGNAYVVGTAYSADFPVTLRTFQSKDSAILNANGTVFVSKFNSTGTALVYSTYLGGSGGDYGYGIALDSASNAYVTGATFSQDFPATCGAYQTSSKSIAKAAPTAFVTKLNPSGTALVYSTYLGGSGVSSREGDVPQGIAVDASGNAYIAGYTFSRNFPVTDDAFQTQHAGDASISSVFVTKLNPGGGKLVYSTFLGGSGSNGTGDYGNAIVIDNSRDAFVAGSSNSSNFPVTGGAFQTANNGIAKGQPTGFVTELNSSGTDEVFSTYLGGDGGDSAQAIAIDRSGFVYVAGNTSSSDFPVTAGALEGTDTKLGEYFGANGVGNGAFVTKLNLDGSAIEYSTYLEGEGTSVTGLAVDSSGSAYVTGSAPTAGVGHFGGFQETHDALPRPASSGSVAFLVKLNPAAATLEYATLQGGNVNDGASALALEGAGNVYLTGFTTSTDFPTTSPSFQTVNNAVAGSSNAFVSKFALASEANRTGYPSLPANIRTSLKISGSISLDCAGNDWEISAYAGVNPDDYGPPPTGTIEVDGDGALLYQGITNCTWAAEGQCGGGGSYTQIDPPEGSFSVPFGATYSGDSVYAGSSASVDVTSNGCPSSDTSAPGRQIPLARFRLPLLKTSDASKTALGSTSARSKNLGPKFTPLIAVPAEDGRSKPVSSSAGDDSAPACILPELVVEVNPASASRTYGVANPEFTYSVYGLLKGDTVSVTIQTSAKKSSPVGTYSVTAAVSGTVIAKYKLTVFPASLTVGPTPLTVTVRPAIGSRLYGATNPGFEATVKGLLNGDTLGGTVIVSEQTTATPASPVGYYPVTATVSGTSAENYSATVMESTLHVRPAPLQVFPDEESSIYGQTPVPPSYRLNGFVNGDTASVVSGAPVLATTVTSTTPVGVYKIESQVGTLTAANYILFALDGVLKVDHAPLTVTASSFTIQQGQPIPTLTYSISGFVNGETQAIVSGAPAFITSATSTSPPGVYAIVIRPGTLSAPNYKFPYDTMVNGTLTIQ
jgi:hypothetical protein